MTFDLTAPPLFVDAERDARRPGNQPFHDLPAALISTPTGGQTPSSVFAGIASFVKSLWNWAPWPVNHPRALPGR